MCDTDHVEPTTFDRREVLGLGAVAAGAAGLALAPGLAGRDAALAASAAGAPGEIVPASYEPPTGLAGTHPAKDTALAFLDRRADAVIGLNDTIWEYAEPSLQEWSSSWEEAQFLRRHGFTIEWAPDGMPSTFVATFASGTGSPVIGFSGEYDALPGLSQKPGSTVHDPLVYHHDPYSPNYGYGHGCGHSALGAAAAGAAVATARAMRRHGLDGTLKFFGSTAEEQLVGKSYAVKRGVYDGLDAFIDWHPGGGNSTSFGSNNALQTLAFNFLGTNGHGGSPAGNKNAQDAVRATTMLTDILREEHMAPSARLHFAIRHAGEVPNVNPSLSGVWFFVREATPERVQILADKVSDCARAAAMVTKTTLHERLTAGVWNKLPNKRGAELVYDNMLQIGPPTFSEADQAYGRGLQESAGAEPTGYATEISPLRPPNDTFLGGGSTDVSDISWNVPTVSLSTAVSPRGTNNHSWIRAGATASNSGHVALMAASRYLAAVAIDLLTDPRHIAEMREEFDARTRGVSWRSVLPDDFQPPVYEPPEWFLRRTQQAWPASHIQWPPERLIAREPKLSLGPPIPPGNVQPMN